MKWAERRKMKMVDSKDTVRDVRMVARRVHCSVGELEVVIARMKDGS